MSRAIPGARYTVQPGDTLSRIAATAYGTSEQWPRIFAANRLSLKVDDPDKVEPGEVLIIPVLPGSKLTPTAPNRVEEITLVIEGQIIPFESIRVSTLADALADAFAAVIAWTPGEDTALDALLKPFSYPTAVIYVAGELVLTGRLYVVTPALEDRRAVTIAGASFAADMVDSVTRPPFEENNVTLKQRAEQLAAQFGLSLEIGEGIPDGAFDRVTIGANESAGNHLANLAAQRGALINSTPAGGLQIVQAATSAPVGTIEEGQAGFQGFSMSFDGRKRYNAYTVLLESPSDERESATAKDVGIPVTRFTTKSADELLAGELDRAAKWKRNKTLADSLGTGLIATGFKAPDGSLWRKNTIATVKSATIFTPEGFNFLLRQVDFVQSPSGKTTELKIIPPQAYTGGDIDEPWR